MCDLCPMCPIIWITPFVRIHARIRVRARAGQRRYPNDRTHRTQALAYLDQPPDALVSWMASHLNLPAAAFAKYARRTLFNPRQNLMPNARITVENYTSGAVLKDADDDTLLSPSRKSPQASRKVMRRKLKRKVGRPPGRTGPEAIAMRERDTSIVAMRARGYSLNEIGKSLDRPLSAQRVHQIVLKHLAATYATMLETMVQHRTMEAQRLDEMQVAVYEKAVGGDLFALDRCLAIMRHRARLLGLDAPTRRENAEPNGSAIERRTHMRDAADTFAAKLARAFAAEKAER